MIEAWIDVRGYEGLYEISNLGNIRSVSTEKIRKPGILKSLYKNITLSKDGKTKVFQLSRLVADHFVSGKGENNYIVGYLDGDRLNVKASNLVWTDMSGAHKLSRRKD